MDQVKVLLICSQNGLCAAYPFTLVGATTLWSQHPPLPGKSARIVELFVQDEHIAPFDALRKFYATNTYRALETEETKCWWESPAQIYRDYLEEQYSLIH